MSLSLQIKLKDYRNINTSDSYQSDYEHQKKKKCSFLTLHDINRIIGDLI